MHEVHLSKEVQAVQTSGHLALYFS